MKKLLLSIFVTTLPLLAYAAAVNPDSVYTLNIFGFVENDMSYDTRESFAIAQELFYEFPKDVRLDADGNDLNAVARGRFLALTARLDVAFRSPVYKGGVSVGGKIEGDFTASNVAHLQMRHAHGYVDVKRPFGNDGAEMHHRLLVGQAFHPMTDNMIPDMVSINTGSPFAPYSRTPQIRYTATMPYLKVTGAALWKFQFASPVMPDMADLKNTYSAMHAVPEILAGIEYTGDHIRIGTQASWMTIRPRTQAVVDGATYKIEGEHCESWTAQAYLKAGNSHWDFRLETMYGQNVAHHLMNSGYAVTAVNGMNYEYSPLRLSNTWAEISYRSTNPVHNYMFGIFGGYMKNFGTTRDAVSSSMIYTKWANNVDQMFRASAIGFYMYHDLKVGLEYEYTGVYYGDIQPNCTVTNTHLIGNHRASLVVLYYFDFKWHFNKKG